MFGEGRTGEFEITDCEEVDSWQEPEQDSDSHEAYAAFGELLGKRQVLLHINRDVWRSYLESELVSKYQAVMSRIYCLQRRVLDNGHVVLNINDNFFDSPWKIATNIEEALAIGCFYKGAKELEFKSPRKPGKPQNVPLHKASYKILLEGITYREAFEWYKAECQINDQYINDDDMVAYASFAREVKRIIARARRNALRE